MMHIRILYPRWNGTSPGRPVLHGYLNTQTSSTPLYLCSEHKHTCGTSPHIILRASVLQYAEKMELYILLAYVLTIKKDIKIWSDIDKCKYRYINSMSDKARIIQQILYWI